VYLIHLKYLTQSTFQQSYRKQKLLTMSIMMSSPIEMSCNKIQPKANEESDTNVQSGLLSFFFFIFFFFIIYLIR